MQRNFSRWHTQPECLPVKAGALSVQMLTFSTTNDHFIWHVYFNVVAHLHWVRNAPLNFGSPLKKGKPCWHKYGFSVGKKDKRHGTIKENVLRQRHPFSSSSHRTPEHAVFCPFLCHAHWIKKSHFNNIKILTGLIKKLKSTYLH
jgi:hypothetical protein